MLWKPNMKAVFQPPCFKGELLNLGGVNGLNETCELRCGDRNLRVAPYYVSDF